MDKPVKVVPNNEIESMINELPVLDLGIHNQEIRSNDPESYEYVPKRTDDELKKLQESSHRWVLLESTGDSDEQYQADLKSFGDIKISDLFTTSDDDDNAGGIAKATDSYIHDYLKRGKPSSKDALHIHELISNIPRMYHRNLVKQKWHPIINKYAAQPPLNNNSKETHLSLDEVNKLGDEFKPVIGRIVQHAKSDSYYELHHDGMRYLGTSETWDNFAPPTNAFRPKLDQNTPHMDISLNKHYTDYPNPHVRQYTEQSIGVNRYLHKIHAGQHYRDDETIFGQTVPHVKEMHQGITEHIKNVPAKHNNKDFYVYTGMYQESRPDMAEHKDEDGNYLFHNPGFTSTSLSKVTAMDFSRSKHVKDVNPTVHDVMRVKIKGGYPKGIYVKPHSDHPHEDEYLLDAGHTFKIRPEPKYFMYDSKVFRQWDATLHHETHPSLPYEAADKQTKILRMLDDNAHPSELAKGAVDEHPDVRAAAAKHPNLEIHHMEKLMDDEVKKVRSAVKSNPSLPHHLMDKAIETDDPSNSGLAQNKNILEKHKQALIKSGFDSVQATFAHRDDLEHHHIAGLIEHGGIKTHAALALNHHTPAEVLNEYVNHEDSRVRQALAMNPNVPRKAIKQLSDDSSALVRTQARANPVYKNSDLYADMESAQHKD